MSSSDYAAHWSFLTMALTSSKEAANEATRRKARIKTFIFVVKEYELLSNQDRSRI